MFYMYIFSSTAKILKVFLLVFFFINILGFLLYLTAIFLISWT